MNYLNRNGSLERKMSSSLEIVLFGYGSKSSILSNLGRIEDIDQYCSNNSNLNMKVIIFDDQVTRYKGPNVTIINKPIYTWNETYSPTGTYTYKGLFHKELNDTLLFDKSPGEVIFICFHDEEVDTYSIMEDLETQVYEKRYYYSHPVGKEFKLTRVLRKWEKEREDSSSEETKSPKYVPEKKKHYYELYSGDEIPDNISSRDQIAIKSRMVLLAETINFYLSFPFDARYSIEDLAKLGETGGEPFFSDENIEHMVKNSYYFQVEDPLLKGFLLAHPPKVVTEKRSQMGEEPASFISPLDIGRDMRWVMFNHDQFRQILLSTMMQVLSTFAANNGFLFREDINIASPVKKKKIVKEEKKEIITEKKGAVTSKSMMRPIKIEEVEEEQESSAIVAEAYRNPALWKKIITRIERTLSD
jgi:hypothetical protein